jgi:hypothetical protein
LSFSAFLCREKRVQVQSVKTPALFRSTILLWLVCMLAAMARAQADEQPLSVAVIVARMSAVLQEARIGSRAFTVRRDYQLFDKKWESKAQVVARIIFVPPDQMRYEVEQSRGGIGEKILRDMLDREMEALHEVSHRELSIRNYDFSLAGEETVDGRRCHVLALHPKREERDLIRGRALVDAETYHVLRLEGEPVKSPSWLIRDLHITMRFADVDGTWMRTLTHAVANVRFRGRYVMESRNLEPPSASAAVSGSREF